MPCYSLFTCIPLFMYVCMYVFMYVCTEHSGVAATLYLLLSHKYHTVTSAGTPATKPWLTVHVPTECCDQATITYSAHAERVLRSGHYHLQCTYRESAAIRPLSLTVHIPRECCDQATITSLRIIKRSNFANMSQYNPH